MNPVIASFGIIRVHVTPNQPRAFQDHDSSTNDVATVDHIVQDRHYWDSMAKR